MRIIFTFIISLICTSTFAQSVKIVVKDSVSNLSEATVSLFKNEKLVKVALTDKSGIAEFENIDTGSYTIQTTASGYEKNILEIIVPTSGVEVSLKKSVGSLAEVTVTAKKPFIQRLRDRLVVNVDNSAVNAGSTALEVLERSPGVTIDPNDVVSLRGKQGVTIMIDGKPSAMNGADLINYLRGLPSASIDRIEIITNPSSKYDAAGNSGIIDIRMKKDQRIGTNGSVNASYGQGVYYKTNSGVSVNHRNKKLNVFGNYNFTARKGLNHLFLDRNFFENKSFQGADLKDNFTTFPLTSHTVRAGADFFPSKNTVIGFVVNSNFSGFKRTNNNNSVVLDNAYTPLFTFKTLATNDDDNNNTVANVNFKHTFGKTKKEITVDADYGEYNSGSFTHVGTSYYRLDGGMQQPDYILDGMQDGKLKLVSGKADYTHPMKNNAGIETGIKSSYVSSDRDAKFFDVSTGTAINDINKTNHFLYKEYNNAAYINFKKDFKKFDMQLGLRAEHTDIRTYQAIGNVRWDSSYLQFFPTAYLNYKLKDDQTLGISVSRRIDRPGYSDLNPFLFLIDVSTYATGNPSLLPQFTWNYELTYSVKQLNFSLAYSHTENVQNIAIARFKSVFPNIPLQDDNITVQIPVNLSSLDYFGFSAAIPFKVKKWWNVVSNADVYYNHFNGNLDGSPLSKGNIATDIRVNNTFSLKNDWTAELSGSYNSGGRDGYMISEPQRALNAGLQKLVMKKKGTLKFNITDIFWKNLPKAVITYENYIEKWHAQRDSRVATVSFAYRFGKNTVQAARKRTTASEEERRRAQ